MLELLRENYEKDKYRYELLGNEVEFILKDCIAEEGIKISNIEKRVKTLDSIIGKIEKKDMKVEDNNPFIFNDSLGVRVICLFLSDLDRIHNIILNEFEVIEADDKVKNSVNEFGYMSIHYICKLRSNSEGRKFNKIKDLNFEIQIRTITMHSWANISHYISYKSRRDMPKDLEKDFNALSGLFYVADKHFEMFFNQSKITKEKIDDSLVEGHNYNQLINLDSLESYLQIKLPDRKVSDRESLSLFLNELGNLKAIKTIKDIDTVIDKFWEAFLLFEEEKFGIDYYQQVGVLRKIFDMYSYEYFLNRLEKSKRDVDFDNYYETMYKKYIDIVKAKSIE